MKENGDYQDNELTNMWSDYSGEKDDDGVRVAKCSVFAFLNVTQILRCSSEIRTILQLFQASRSSCSKMVTPTAMFPKNP